MLTRLVRRPLRTRALIGDAAATSDLTYRQL